jgi:DNA-binding transcriptional MerR regulator
MTNVTKNILTIGQLAELCGLTIETIRSYESAGILSPTARAPNGHKRYQEDDVLWLQFVMKLNATSMPLAEIKDYADLREQGDSTLQARITLLELHRERLLAKMKKLLEQSSEIEDEIRAHGKSLAKRGKVSGPPIQ